MVVKYRAVSELVESPEWRVQEKFHSCFLHLYGTGRFHHYCMIAFSVASPVMNSRLWIVILIPENV